ncbi:MAG: lysophospholipid transporter LplT [Vitreoscilla sp.]
MKRGFYTIMSAQFFSSLADNALFVAAIELLKSAGSAEWQRAALVPMFALFYVVLAPIVGAFADALPKGKVMFYSNGIKVVGCLMMLFGGHPLISYAVVGLGAAAYSPAKYGILTELLPTSQLVKANGWIEGLTILSIILGVVLGGQLVGPKVAPVLLGVHLPWIDLGIDTPAQAAIACMVVLYVIAALFNLRIPRTDTEMEPMTGSVSDLVRDFSQCNARLWDDKLGQISLATTTLFWGVSKNLQYVVLAWAGVALSYPTARATLLVGVVAIGTAAGAVLASMSTRLDRAVRVIVLGVLMGVLVAAMNAIHSVAIAAPFLVVLGALGGYLVVPMNALLQHRGHNLMGSGRSIAVQNFNEQAAILGLGAFYTGMTRIGVSVYGSITIFGLFTAIVSLLVMYWHRRNLKTHPEELRKLLEIARSDNH